MRGVSPFQYAADWPNVSARYRAHGGPDETRLPHAPGCFTSCLKSLVRLGPEPIRPQPMDFTMRPRQWSSTELFVSVPRPMIPFARLTSKMATSNGSSLPRSHPLCPANCRGRVYLRRRWYVLPGGAAENWYGNFGRARSRAMIGNGR